MPEIENNRNEKSRYIFFTYALLPSFFSWVLLTAFFLVYSFDMIDYITYNNIFPGVHALFIMAVWAIPAGITGSFSGMVIDRYPKHLGNITTLGLVGSSLFLAFDMIALLLVNGVLLIITVFCLGAFMGVLAICSHTLYGTSIPSKYRGRGYSCAIFGFALSSILLLFLTETLKMDFFFSFFMIALFGIIFSIIFYYYIRNQPFWKNDPWATPLKRILKRPSVGAYYWTHVLIYLMLGLAIGSLAHAGVILGFSAFLEIGWYKSFWVVVLFSSLIFSLPFGFLTDYWGRKTSIVLAIYGIVFASLLVGLFNQYAISFIISGFIIGTSFALIHPALDGSLWVDLASRDSIGRYSSLGIQSLGLGMYIGFPLSYLLISEQIITTTLVMNVFILVGLAILAGLPLFWIGDSFPPLEFFLLLVINDAGMPIFHYDFAREKELLVDLPLISGALSAVGSFMLEATGEKNAKLNLVKHGSHFIISEEGEMGLSAAIFANKNDPELHALQQKFLHRFVEKYKDIIANWKGDLSAFKDAVNDAEEIFGPLVTIQVK